jgi:hypothetical protein
MTRALKRWIITESLKKECGFFDLARVGCHSPTNSLLLLIFFIEETIAYVRLGWSKNCVGKSPKELRKQTELKR